MRARHEGPGIAFANPHGLQFRERVLRVSAFDARHFQEELLHLRVVLRDRYPLIEVGGIHFGLQAGEGQRAGDLLHAEVRCTKVPLTLTMDPANATAFIPKSTPLPRRR